MTITSFLESVTKIGEADTGGICSTGMVGIAVSIIVWAVTEGGGDGAV